MVPRRVAFVALRLAVCLIGGALLTFATAAVAVQQPRKPPRSFDAVTGVIDWPRRMPAGCPDHATRLSRGRYPACMYFLYSATGSSLYLLRIEAGWPLPAARVDIAAESGGGAGSDGWVIGKRTVIPRHILWPGFALDTAFYGTLAFLLWSAPGFVRRRRRRGRGLCVACGYELKGLEKCPECGAS